MNWYRTSLLVGCYLLLSACATSSIEKQGSAYRIVVPASDWVLEFPGEGFKVNTADTSRPYYFLSSPDINVSFNFDRATKCTSSESCRDYHADRLKAAYPHPRKQGWRMSQVGDVFVSENTDGVVEGFNLRQRHWNAHYVREGIWVDVHLSKTDYRESDRELFVRFIRSVKVKPKSATAVAQTSATSERRLTFTILTNEGQELIVKQALDLLKGAAQDGV